MKTICSFFVRSAACSFLALSLASIAHSQQPEAPSAAISTGQAIDTVDPKAHEAALRLVQALDLKQKMAAGVDTMLEQGVQGMKTQFPDIRPEFTEEWRTRMKARMKPEDFVAIVVQVYEKHFTVDELDQLINVINGKNEGKATEMPDALKEKFQKNAIAIQSEIVGGTTQFGARLGGEVGEEIGKEHPEWAPPLAAKPAQTTK